MNELEHNKEHQNLRITFHKETGMYAIKHKKEYTYWLEKRVVNNINYTHSSTLLKDKDEPTFEEWLKSEGYEETNKLGYYKKDNKNIAFKRVHYKYYTTVFF